MMREWRLAQQANRVPSILWAIVVALGIWKAKDVLTAARELVQSTLQVAFLWSAIAGLSLLFVALFWACRKALSNLADVNKRLTELLDPRRQSSGLDESGEPPKDHP